MKIKTRRMLKLTGKGVSPGMARGKAFIYKDVLLRDSEDYTINDSQIAEEKARIQKAVDDVRQSLAVDAKQIEHKLGKQPADIFRAQEMILRDAYVVKEMKRLLEKKMLNAEQVVRVVFRVLARRFRDLDNAILRERGDDIDDLSRRLLLSLAGIHAHSLENLPADTVLVARRLLPSDTVFLSRSSTVGVLAEFAGPAAHAALIARELGIPCVGGIPDLLERENPLVVDYFIDDHPAVLRLIELVVKEAEDTPVSICGELAGRTEAIQKVLATGIRSISVAASLIPDLKQAIRKIYGGPI